MSFAASLRLMLAALYLLCLLAAGTTAHAQAGGSEASQAADTAPAAGTVPAGTAPVETVLQSRNKVVLTLSGKPVSLRLTIRSFATGRRLLGDASFAIEGEEAVEATNELTCTPSLTLGCGVVTRFSSARSKAAAPTVFEAQLDDGVFRIRDGSSKDHPDKDGPDRDRADSQGFEAFIEGVIGNASMAVKVRVDQQQDFVFDLRRLPWPLADFGADHPFARQFAKDPVLEALKQRYPARYLKIVTLVRKEVPDTGSLAPEAELKILEAMHASVGSLRPMVSDELLERIVMNADAAARQVGSRDVALCNALAVAARSAVTTPELKDTPVARQEYELWRQVVEQADPRFVRKVPNEELLASTPRFEENVRQANESGCGMFAAVVEAILKLPRHERRLWLRATVGTVEDLRGDAPPARR